MNRYWFRGHRIRDYQYYPSLIYRRQALPSARHAASFGLAEPDCHKIQRVTSTCITASTGGYPTKKRFANVAEYENGDKAHILNDLTEFQRGGFHSTTELEGRKLCPDKAIHVRITRPNSPGLTALYITRAKKGH